MPDARPTSHADASSAFASLVESHRAYLMRTARRKLRDAGDVEDVVQETLIAAWQARSAFRGQSALRTWLVGILQHKIVDVVRQRARRPTVSLDAGDDADGSADHGGNATFALASLAARHALDVEADDGILATLERRELCSRVLSELESYSPKAAQIFLLREIEGEPTAAICRRLEVSDANCYVLLHRARQFVQQRFAGEAMAA